MGSVVPPKNTKLRSSRFLSKGSEYLCVRVCVCVYQYTADSLCSAGLLAVCCPVQRDLALTVRDADVGVMLDQKANVFWSVIKCRPVESGLLHRER